MSKKSKNMDESENKGMNKWLKICIICLALVVLAAFLYLILLVPAMNEHNEMIDRQIEELRYGK